MRMLFLVVLLIIPGMARAVNSDCRQITGQNAQTTCENTAGCHWEYSCFPCNEDHYCPGNNNAQILCSSIGTGFNRSDEGSENEQECYKSIDCQDATGTPQPCRHYNTTDNPYRCGSNLQTSAHIESDLCYYNHRDCGLFDATGCTNGQQYGDAVWENNKWNLVAIHQTGTYLGCRCKDGNFTNDTCGGKHTVKVKTQTAASVQSQITYTDGDIISYYCTSCNDGYYIETIYNYNNAPENCANANNNVVCGCSIIPQGWYGTPNCSWGANTPTSGTCPKNPCPAGQTTQTTGATSVNACQYTTQTQFCDNQGCFTLSDAGDWTITP